MTDFATEATFEAVIDSASLRDARQTVEDELGDIEVEVAAQTSGAGGAGGGEMASRDRAMGRKLQSQQLDTLDENLGLDEERNDLLQEIVETEAKVAAQTDSGGGGELAQRERAMGRQIETQQLDTLDQNLELDEDRNELLSELVDAQEQGNYDRATRGSLGGGMLAGGAVVAGVIGSVGSALSSALGTLSASDVVTPVGLAPDDVVATAASIATGNVIGTAATVTAEAVIGSKATVTAADVIGQPATITAADAVGSVAAVSATDVIGSVPDIAAGNLIGAAAEITAGALIGSKATITLKDLVDVVSGTSTKTPDDTGSPTPDTTPTDRPTDTPTDTPKGIPSGGPVPVQNAHKDPPDQPADSPTDYAPDLNVQPKDVVTGLGVGGAAYMAGKAIRGGARGATGVVASASGIPAQIAARNSGRAEQTPDNQQNWLQGIFDNLVPDDVSGSGGSGTPVAMLSPGMQHLPIDQQGQQSDPGRDRSGGTGTTVNYEPTYKLETQDLERQLRQDKKEIEKRLRKVERALTRQ